MTKKRTQNKENYYYIFWIIAMVAFIVPQVFTAYGIMKITDFLDNKVDKVIIQEIKIK
jgi:hypothetical protein|tara:strand:- start:129 stop:302 length:174 start_codon:yes stop_codon:yes gene_type:complete